MEIHNKINNSVLPTFFTIVCFIYTQDEQNIQLNMTGSMSLMNFGSMSLINLKYSIS